MMNSYDQKLTQLEGKLVALIGKTKTLISENQDLKIELEACQKEIDFQKNRIKDLEENNKMVKIAGTISDSEADSVELKKRIEQYMKEIDQCIALLSS